MSNSIDIKNREVSLVLNTPSPLRDSRADDSSIRKAAARGFARLGFKIVATEGTARFLAKHGVECATIAKIGEGRPDILDIIKNREVSLVLNTPSPLRDSRADDSSIRKAAIKHKIPYITTLAAATATVHGIAAAQSSGNGGVKSLQSYHSSIG